MNLVSYVAKIRQLLELFIKPSRTMGRERDDESRLLSGITLACLVAVGASFVLISFREFQTDLSFLQFRLGLLVMGGLLLVSYLLSKSNRVKRGATLFSVGMYIITTAILNDYAY